MQLAALDGEMLAERPPSHVAAVAACVALRMYGYHATIRDVVDASSIADHAGLALMCQASA